MAQYWDLPRESETPTDYADRLGHWYLASVVDNRRKSLGQYLTPVAVARFMADLCQPAHQPALRILDPAAGAGVLLCALCESLAERSDGSRRIHLDAYEVDAGLSRVLESCLGYLARWLQPYDTHLTFRVHTDDFVLANAGVLNETPALFDLYREVQAGFDLIIANPPYFKLPKSDVRAQAAAKVVHGQPNIYALFMAISACLLKPSGKLVFITPRSYASGPYFRLFREFFFSKIRPEVVHLFGSRRDAFSRDEILQENVILVGQREDEWVAKPAQQHVRISSSFGTRDLGSATYRYILATKVIDWTTRDRVFRMPITDEDEAVTKVVRTWSKRLSSYGLEVSTGPVVAFRAKSFICDEKRQDGDSAPLLWMQNVQPMRVMWPIRQRGKGQYIDIAAESLPLLLPSRNYVLIRRFSAKEQTRRLTAAPLIGDSLHSPMVGIENHLNYVHRPGGSLTSEEAYGLAVLFNSSLLDTYLRTYNGNTQVSAAEMREMPLPAMEDIREIGRRAMSLRDPGEIVDSLIADVLQLAVLPTVA